MSSFAHYIIVYDSMKLSMLFSFKTAEAVLTSTHNLYFEQKNEKFRFLFPVDPLSEFISWLDLTASSCATFLIVS